MQIAARGLGWILPALVSWGCCNKLPQTCWLHTTEIYFFTFLEARNQGVGRATRPSGDSWGESFPWGLSAFLVFLGVWPHHSKLSHSHDLSLSIFYKGASLGLGSTQVIRDALISRSLTPLYLQGPLFQTKSHSQVPGIGTRTYLLESHHQTYYPTYAFNLNSRNRFCGWGWLQTNGKIGSNLFHGQNKYNLLKHGPAL